MVFGADAFASWLLAQVADAGRKRLTAWVLGTEQERALRQAAAVAVQRTAEELHPQAVDQATEIAMVINHVFREPMPRPPIAQHATLLEALQAGIASQLAPLGDAELTGTGMSSAELLGVSAPILAKQLTSHITREIVVRGAGGGSLAPLANQLNHDMTHLHGQRVEGKLDWLANGVLEALAGLKPGLTAARPAAAHYLPADVVSFTGRHAELAQLMRALPGRASMAGVVRIDAIDGMAGVGKTAFAVHAAHQLAPHFPDGQIFVRLHGHTSGQRPVEPADALATLLLATGIMPQQIPAGMEARAGLWRDRMAGRKALLLLDDATGSEQVRPLLPGTEGVLVLVTSRRRLTGLPEALRVTLDIMQACEAAELFAQLASRPGLQPTDCGVAEVVRLCGYLPLAISLMAGQLKHHPTWTTADLAADLESAADRLAPMAAENHSVAAAFGLSYRNLPTDQQRLFRRLGLHIGTDIDAYAAAALDGTDLATARRLLDDLFGYHLIVESARGRYRFHDLIREHARALASADQAAERDAAVGRLLDYYLHTARSADRHFPQRTPAGGPAVTGIPPPCGPALPTREDAVTWMDAERLNLHAAADHAALNDRPAHAIAIPAAMNSFLRTQGHWDQALTLHHTALNAARHTGDRLAQADALNNLGTVQRMTGDYPAAAASQIQALEMYRQLGNELGEANALNDLGIVQQATGNYPAAAASQIQALELYRRLGNRPGEANAFNDLGLVQRRTDDYPAASASHTHALELYRDLGNRLGQAYALNYLGAVQQATGDYPAASASHTHALELYRDLGNRLGEANALNYLGAVQQATGDYPAASASHTHALELYRDLDDSLGEAEALNELGVVQRLSGVYPAASVSHNRTLELYRDLGNRLGEAKTLNNMGELSLASATPAEAHARHKQAHAIATAIASRLEEARAQEGIGRCHLQVGQAREGAASLRQALALYHQIGSPNAGRVQTTLRDHGL